MTQDLTTSQIERQNVLNNRIAIPRIQDAIGVHTLEFEGKFYLTKQMVADFFEVDMRTIDNYLSTYESELKNNGYILCKGKILSEFNYVLLTKLISRAKQPNWDYLIFALSSISGCF